MVTDLQLGACIFVPEAEPPIRANCGQGTVDRVECNGIHLETRSCDRSCDVIQG